MARLSKLVLLAAMASAVVSLSLGVLRAQDAKATLEAAAKALGDVNSIQYSGSGSNNAYGQAFKPGDPWPAFKVTSYTATVDYKAPAMRVELDRTNPDGVVRGGGGLPLLAPQKQNQAVSGKAAWNVAAAPGGGAPAPAPAQAALNDRLLAIWTTPHGAIKAAQQNNATVAGKVVSFNAQGVPFKVTLGGDNLVQKVETRADAPVLGDVVTETTYSAYKDFGGVKFPTRIVQRQAGSPVLDLTITDVKPNAAAAIEVPANVQQAAAQPAAPPPVTVNTEKVADGVYFLTGGSHHSVAVEFSDHVVLYETPQTEARGMAVIEATRKAIPNKPIKYVINSHNHFDHLGGIRAPMAEGITIITQAENKSYYENTVAKAPHTIVPDKLAQSPKKVMVEGVAEKRVLTDGTRTMELYRLTRSPHTDTMLIGYLPKEKILMEVDVYTPAAANAPAPTQFNPTTVAFYDWVQSMKLDVNQILPGHGPRAATMKDLQTAAGKS
jgi:glyoxylase-like metal-dependent hydrolase (beta-lactamase superfamily II)